MQHNTQCKILTVATCHVEGTTSASNGYIGIESSHNNAFPHTTRSPPMYYAYFYLKWSKAQVPKEFKGGKKSDNEYRIC